MTPAEYLKSFSIVNHPGELAKRMRVSPQYVSDILNERRRLSPRMAEKLIEALNLSNNHANTLHRLGAQAAGWKV